MIHSEHKYCIYDLDGTLSDTTHRVHLAQAKLWDDFHSEAHLDKPFDKIVKLLKLTAKISKNIILTGRDIKFIGQTNDWFQVHDMSPYIHDVIMRPIGNYTPDHELKIQMLDTYFGGREFVLDSIWLVIEDRDRNVEAMRNIGLTVLQCCAGAY